MSISAVSSSTILSYQPNSQRTTLRQALGQLSNALGSGDLSAAQQAYSSLGNLVGNSSRSNAAAPFSQALDQIGQALQSGNLSDAQKAMASLQQATQGAQGAHHHRHHHHSAGGDAGSASGATAATSTSGAGSSNAGRIDIVV